MRYQPRIQNHKFASGWLYTLIRPPAALRPSVQIRKPFYLGGGKEETSRESPLTSSSLYMRACVRACVRLDSQQSISEDSSRLKLEIFLTGHIFRLFLRRWRAGAPRRKARLQRNKKTRERNDDTSWKCQRFDRTGTVVSRARRPRSASRQMENIDFQ